MSFHLASRERMIFPVSVPTGFMAVSGAEIVSRVRFFAVPFTVGNQMQIPEATTLCKLCQNASCVLCESGIH